MPEARAASVVNDHDDPVAAPLWRLRLRGLRRQPRTRMLGDVAGGGRRKANVRKGLPAPLPDAPKAQTFSDAPTGSATSACGTTSGAYGTRKDPFSTALDVCESMLRLIQEVEKARELRWERGIGVPPAFGMRDSRIRTIPM